MKTGQFADDLRPGTVVTFVLFSYPLDYPECFNSSTPPGPDHKDGSGRLLSVRDNGKDVLCRSADEEEPTRRDNLPLFGA
jgi:hypothetical protein